MTDPAWQADLTFLVDMTQRLNDLNLKLQGKYQLICQLANHIWAFMTKLQLFRQQATSENFVHFPTFQSQLQNSQGIDTKVYVAKLDTLVQSFNSRFHDFDQCRLLMKLFADPFNVSVDDLSAEYQLELTDLQASDELRATYRENSLLDFYRTLPDTFANLKDNALVHTSMFCSTYCEQAFSQMKLNKSNIRNQLTDDNLEAISRLSTSNIKPDISTLTDDIATPSITLTL
ncbi:hypothetical protein ACJMK2_019654 [Sinanodonta woodiana]|uniref:General transcription factor II-I repeat domain-containing protein 2 n=1 Tax=Sinanodonta woodiana TaxID=1069815 RepID=A0ABD3TWM4_SINWO